MLIITVLSQCYWLWRHDTFVPSRIGHVAFRQDSCIRKPATYFFALVRACTSEKVYKSTSNLESKKVDSQMHFQEE